MQFNLNTWQFAGNNTKTITPCLSKSFTKISTTASQIAESWEGGMGGLFDVRDIAGDSGGNHFKLYVSLDVFHQTEVTKKEVFFICENIAPDLPLNLNSYHSFL